MRGTGPSSRWSLRITASGRSSCTTLKISAAFDAAADDTKPVPDGVKRLSQQVAVHFAGLRNEHARWVPA